MKQPSLRGPVVGRAGGTSAPPSKPGLAGCQRIGQDYASVPKDSRGAVRSSATDDGNIPPGPERAFPLRVDELSDPADEGCFTLASEPKLDLSQQTK